MFIMGAVAGPLGRVALASATRYLPAAEVSLFTPVETVRMQARAVMMPRPVETFTPWPLQSISVAHVDNSTGMPRALCVQRVPYPSRQYQSVPSSPLHQLALEK